VRVVGVIVHGDDDVVAVVEAAGVHVTHEVNECMVIAQKHVDFDQTHTHIIITAILIHSPHKWFL